MLAKCSRRKANGFRILEMPLKQLCIARQMMENDYFLDIFRFVTVNNKLFEVGILTISAVLTNCVRN